jgi:hypothetical protein
MKLIKFIKHFPNIFVFYDFQLALDMQMKSFGKGN